MDTEERRSEPSQTADLPVEQTDHHANSAGYQRIRVRVKKGRSKRRSKKLLVLLPILLCMVVGGSIFAAIEYLTYSGIYHKDLALAQMGIVHLRRAETLLVGLSANPLNALAVTQAQQEFAAALNIFVRLDTDLKTLPAISTSIPRYGARLSAALHILPPTIEVAEIGVIACNTLNLLISRFHDPLTSHNQGLTQADFAVVQQNFGQIKTTLKLVIDQVNRLQSSDLQLDPRLVKIVATFHKDMPVLQTWLNEGEQLLPVAPVLLGIGTPTNYLIEVLDSDELRPGGGFIGNYGIATLSEGRLMAAHITDVDLLDRPFEAAGNMFPYPPEYSWFNLAPAWSFRDSNLDADFPTAARYGEQNYMREGGNVAVQGVIAITPTLIQHALDITGPIYVPEYHETVTAQNLVTRIHYYQLGAGNRGSDRVPSPDGYSSQRKHFTALLAEHFLVRVHQLPSSALPKFLQLLLSSLRSKDIQVYLNSSIAEKALQQYHLDAAIQSPAGDSFFVVDANVAGNKANYFITYTLDDQVTIDAQGNAVHQTTLSYTWTTPGEIYGEPLYKDYVRVYVPLGSILQAQNGWEPQGTSEAFGREVWAGFFTLTFGQTRTIVLAWTAHSAAKKDVHGWHYQYLIQRQAGIQWILHLQITLSSCSAIDNKLGGLVLTGKRTAMLIHALNEDMNVGFHYTC